jgi:hypothetical protein
MPRAQQMRNFAEPMRCEQRTQLAKDKWSEVVRNFVLDHARPLLSREEQAFFHSNFAAVA